MMDQSPTLSPPPSGSQLRRVASVTAQGSVSLVPDHASINLSAESSGDTLAEANQRNGQVIKDIVAVLKNAGVNDEDVQRTSFLVSSTPLPFLGSTSTPPRITVTTQMYATVGSVNGINDLINALISAGATAIYGPYLYAEDSDKLREAARKVAIGNAHAYATELATMTGGTVGQIVYLSEVLTSAGLLERTGVVGEVGGFDRPVGSSGLGGMVQSSLGNVLPLGSAQVSGMPAGGPGSAPAAAGGVSSGLPTGQGGGLFSSTMPSPAAGGLSGWFGNMLAPFGFGVAGNVPQFTVTSQVQVVYEVR